jgi:undecaprenyl pyrophosphate phosphatase UppP
MVALTVRGVDMELEWYSVADFLLWCLPLFVIGALLRDRVAKGYRFDLAAVAVAVVVSAAAVVLRYCRHRCPVAAALVRIRKEIRSMQ